MIFEFIGKRAIIRLTLAGFVAGAACAQTPASQDRTASSGASSVSAEKVSSADHVVIKVGKAEVTQSDFESNIGELEPQGEEAEGAAEKSLRRRGEDYASVLMLSQLAVADHLDDSPEVKRRLEVGRIQVLSDAEFAKLLRQAEPTSEEISKYYSGHLADSVR